MIEEQPSLKHHAQPPILGGDEHARPGIVDDPTGQLDATGVERQDARQGVDGGRLARAVGAQQRRGTARIDRQVDIEHEGVAAPNNDPGAQADASVDREARHRPHQRSRNATSTTSDTATNTRLIATAASRSDSSAMNTANGNVWVRP